MRSKEHGNGEEQNSDKAQISQKQEQNEKPEQSPDNSGPFEEIEGFVHNLCLILADHELDIFISEVRG